MRISSVGKLAASILISSGFVIKEGPSVELLGAFFAVGVESDDDGNPNLLGCGIGETTVPEGTTTISPAIVCLFESGGDDVGKPITIRVGLIDKEGNRLPGQNFNSTLPGIVQVVPLGQDVVVLPIRPEGGHHVYLVEFEETVRALPLDVTIQAG